MSAKTKNYLIIVLICGALIWASNNVDFVSDQIG